MYVCADTIFVIQCNTDMLLLQVSHQGRHIDGGFCSGAASDSPSAFMHQFSRTGVYYYISQAIPKEFGAIVVNSNPRVGLLQWIASTLRLQLHLSAELIQLSVMINFCQPSIIT